MMLRSNLKLVFILLIVLDLLSLEAMFGKSP